MQIQCTTDSKSTLFISSESVRRRKIGHSDFAAEILTIAFHIRAFGAIRQLETVRVDVNRNKQTGQRSLLRS